jgi:hypothetical protein
VLSRESQATVLCLQVSVSVSLETVVHNQLVSKEQSLRGDVFASLFPRDGPHVTILVCLMGLFPCEVTFVSPG